MRTKVTIFLIMCMFSLRLMGQVAPSALHSGGLNLKVGVGMDDWFADYNSDWRYGPAAWVSGDITHGIGILVEGHSMIGGDGLPHYKYFVGEGGLLYTVYRWRNIQPFAKAEMGFAGLSFPQYKNLGSHDTRNTYALGAGAEYRIYHHVWGRLDYTYDYFPQFLSYVTLKKHTLNPTGLTGGFTYHFSR